MWLNGISPEFQQLLKDLRNNDHRGFVVIPEGANESHECNTVIFDDTAPIARYCDPNSRRCVLSSAASGLFYLGFKTLAWYLNSAKSCKRTDEKAFDFFRTVMIERMTDSERNTLEVIHRPKEGDWNMLIDAPKYLLCILGIRSMDGKTDHCICVVNPWIFDSNFTKALPLTNESLDICASSSERKTSYAGITRGYLLKEKQIK